MPDISWWGHSTVTIEDSGVRVLTDPVLTSTVGHLRRRGGPPPAAAALAADVVVVSHLHGDHLHLRSLAKLAPSIPVVVPRGALREVSGLRRLGRSDVVELAAGEELQVGALRIRAVPARHDGRRHRLASGSAPAMGYVITGQARTYFAGDTDLFPEMAAAVGGCDVALLGVGGWGPGLGPGHLTAGRAVQAALEVGAGSAVPIHYGTLWPVGCELIRPQEFHGPGPEFARQAMAQAPALKVGRLRPGQTDRFEPAS